MPRHITLLCIFLLACTLACGQESYALSVSNAAVHVLYRGYNNPVQISTPAVAPAAISLECPDALVTHNEKDKLWYVSLADSAKDITQLRIYKTDNGKKVLLREQICKVTDRPEPTIVALIQVNTDTLPDGKTNTRRTALTRLQSLPRKALLKDAKLMADYPPESMQSASLTITSFTAEIMQTKYECPENRFSSEAKKAISQLKAGSQINLSDIRATDSRGKAVNIAPCTFILR